MFVLVVANERALDAPITLPRWIMLGLFFLASVSVFHIQFRRDAHSFSLSEIPLTLGLFFVAPYALVLTQFGGGGLALALRRRQSVPKLLLTLILLTAGACIAILLFHGILGPEKEFGPRAWLAALLAVFVASLMTDLVVFLVHSFTEGGADHRVLGGALRVGAFASFASISLALCAAALLWSEPTAIWMLLALTAALFLAYRAYASIRRKHESLAVLYESGAATGDAKSLEAVLETLLAGACETFSCEIAELVLPPRQANEDSLRSTRWADGRVDMLEPDSPIRLPTRNVPMTSEPERRGATIASDIPRARSWRLTRSSSRGSANRRCRDLRRR